ncbi:MAG TPA: ATP-binding cassette domain-containing protein [Gaiellales bacterium]|jgi:ABC-2 type transport system ATP-binding protein|nr:ATP-binding cassette domain-containing protein [Gaiellales bacterium]
MIDVQGLSKRYGDRLAVDDLTFTVKPGIVTGFLGPNGAGKSTTMRLMLGLDRPSAGRATVNGRAYRDFEAPLHEVGALLEARAIHTGRSAYNHLLAQAQTHAIGRDRVDEVIRLVGLESVARKRVGGFSLGMGQRLGIAAALLGDPATLILDEPSNGLDPEGIRWIRNLLKQLAAEGRTVFVSSHLMSEIALTAERLVVIGRGRLIADTSVEDFVRSASGDAAVRVRSADQGRLAELLAAQGAHVEDDGDALSVSGTTSEEIGRLALEGGIALSELVVQEVSLEDAFMRITRDSLEFRGDQGGHVDEPVGASA